MGDEVVQKLHPQDKINKRHKGVAQNGTEATRTYCGAFFGAVVCQVDHSSDSWLDVGEHLGRSLDDFAGGKRIASTCTHDPEPAGLVLLLQGLDLAVDEAHGDRFTTNSFLLQIIDLLKELLDLVLVEELLQLLLSEGPVVLDRCNVRVAVGEGRG